MDINRALLDEDLSWVHVDPAIFIDLTSLTASSSQTSLASSSSPLPSRNYLYPRKEHVEELRPEEVRWFHKRKTEKKWNAFIGYDSLRIECKYRELSHGTCVTRDTVEMVLVCGGLYEVDVDSKTCFPVYWFDDLSTVLRGTWFQDITWQPLEDMYANVIEIEHMQNFCGKRLDELPETPKRGPRPILHNMKFADFYVDWNGPDEMYMFSESTSSRLMRQFSQSLGFQKSGTRLRRGYCFEAVMDDKPEDITHLVFVVHGIGQKMSTGSIVKCCKSLRETVTDVKTKQFPHLYNNGERAEFLPVEWRTNLKLDGEAVDAITPQKMKSFRTLVNSSAMDVLYYTSPLYRSEIIHGLRTELNRLYLMFCDRNPYFVPRNGKLSIIAHSLGAVITYDILTDWNPIHVYDQFLSSVIDEEMEHAAGCQDLLNQLDTARSRVKDLESLLIAVHNKQQQHSPPLNFQIENLFCLGSPLAVFLTLRGHQPSDILNTKILHSSVCSRILNIYHPADPVAYRLEPLLLKRYTTIPPVLIQRCDTAKSVPYADTCKPSTAGVEAATCDSGDTPTADGRVNDETNQSAPSIAQPRFSFANVAGMLSRLSRSRSMDTPGAVTMSSLDLSKSHSNGEVCNGRVLEVKSEEASDERRPRAERLEQLTPDCEAPDIEYRVDYQLKESNFESSYISTITSHTSYWTNHDVASFILLHLYNSVLLDATPKSSL